MAQGTYTYTLTCQNSAGTKVSSDAQVFVGPAPIPVVFFSASPSTIDFGGNTTLSWSSNNAVSCTGSGSDATWSSQNPKPTSGTITFSNLQVTTTYSITCVNKTGQSSPIQKQTVTVGAPPVPVVSFTATPSTIDFEGNTTLSWSSSNAVSCTGSGDATWSSSNPKPPSGTITFTSLQSTRTYSITCVSKTGQSSPVQSQTVTVGTAPIPPVFFSATPATLEAGGNTTLSWSSTDAVSCTGSGSDVTWSSQNPKPTSGTVTFTSLQFTTTYSISCTNKLGAASPVQSQTVAVGPTLIFTVNPISIDYGAQTLLSWIASPNTASCAPSGFTASMSLPEGSVLVLPPKSTMYSMTCQGKDSSFPPVIKTASVAVKPIFSKFETSPDFVKTNESATFTWEASPNAVSCEATGDWAASGLPISGSKVFSNLLATQDFTFSCVTSDNLIITQKGSITVIPVPVISSFTADKTTVNLGESVTVTWAVMNATGCTIFGTPSGEIPVEFVEGTHTRLIPNFTKSTTLTLVCQNGDSGIANKRIEITVNNDVAPVITFSSNKTTINSGESVTVTYSVKDATKCVATGPSGWLGVVSSADGTYTKTVPNITNSVTLELLCYGISKSTLVKVPITVIKTEAAVCADKGGKCKLSSDTCFGTVETASDCTVGTICCVASSGSTVSSGQWVSAPAVDGTGLLINLIGSTMLGFWQAIPDGSGWQIISGGSGSTAPVLNGTGNLQIIPNTDGSWQVLPVSGSPTTVNSVQFAPNGTGGWGVVPVTGTASSGGGTEIGGGTTPPPPPSGTPPGPGEGSGLVPCGTGDVPGGNIEAAKAAAEDCQFEDFMALAKNVMDFLLFTIAIPIAAISFAWAGWLYMSAAGNESRVSEAHQIFKYVVLGLCVALAAWLIVNAIVVGLGVGASYNPLSGGAFGG
jgi:hypothetical protein